MSNPLPTSPAPQGQGLIILLATLFGAVLIPVAVWCAMRGEGGIACALRALAVTAISVAPGLLIGGGGGLFLVCRRGRQSQGRKAP
jgi:hypothetical protein